MRASAHSSFPDAHYGEDEAKWADSVLMQFAE
jgi:hypothetical protein